MMNASTAAIMFALETDDGLEFLRLWSVGEFDDLRRGWPDAPEEVFIGADPLHPQTKARSTACPHFGTPHSHAEQHAAVDMVLFCPRCHTQHIDAPEPSMLAADAVMFGGDWPDRWTNPPHRSHLCAKCGCVWRPADVATNGVAAVKTTGKADTPLAEQHAATEEKYHELLYAVGNKYPDETRHETALRYIRGAEQHAARVPDMLVVSMAASSQYAMGWNDCRAEMLAAPTPPAQPQ